LTGQKHRKILNLVNVDELQKLTSNGFKPFTLHLSDGRSFQVPHPDFIALSRRVVVVIDAEGLPNLIDPLQVVSARPNIGERG